MSTARKLHWSGAVGKSEADHLALDLEYARSKCRPNGALAHYLEVNERRLNEMLEEKPVDLCGCGRPKSPPHGRCGWLRAQGAIKANGHGGGVAITKRPYVRKQKAEIVPSESPQLEPVEDLERCEFSIRVVRPGIDIKLLSYIEHDGCRFEILHLPDYKRIRLAEDPSFVVRVHPGIIHLDENIYFTWQLSELRSALSLAITLSRLLEKPLNK